VFSYDRPLQLYALLESVEQYLTGLEKTTVIYRTSNYDFTVAYGELVARFPWATFLQQGENPAEDFKPLVLEATFESPSKYEIYKELHLMNYRNPNSFEAEWAGRGHRIMERVGLCFAESKILNLPLNVVQSTCANRNMQAFSAATLLAMFNSGLKFDLKPTFK